MSDIQPESRERVIRWEDPRIAPGEARRRAMSGLDFLRAIRAGELPPPPIAVLMGMRLETVDKGRVIFSVEPAEYHYNPIGVVHGGLAATLLDSAMGCAVQTLAPAGVAYTTVELKVNYVRPLRSGMGIVRGEGTVLHFGRQIALAEARVTDQDGKLYAHATSTCLIMRPNSPSERTPEESR